jgi:CBS domain containing-hemolysin-like protein
MNPDIIAASILLILAIGGIVVRKTYCCLPVHELKRRAERRDHLAVTLYRAVSYGSSLRLLLWTYIALCGSAGFVLLARVTPVWFSFVAVTALFWVALAWLPASRVSIWATRLTTMVTPAIAWVLNYVYPLLDRLATLTERLYTAPRHTGLFESSDLLSLLERQAGQTDSRIRAEKLELMKRALGFDKQYVTDILVPARDIKTVLAGDTVGPILINELYQQGQDFVLVRESRSGPVVGILESKRLDLKTTGRVGEIMNATVYYVHERDTLGEALQAFFVTDSPLFVVVNTAQEYVGVVTTQSILHSLLGQLTDDDFDQYVDMQAVAARHLKPKSREADELVIDTGEVLE